MLKKRLSQVDRYIKLNRINQAMVTLKKVIANPDIVQQEKNSALYMLAYLYSSLAHQQRHNQDACLGVDLRQVQQDHYLWAAKYLSQIQGEFDAVAESLPAICPRELQLIEEIYQHQLQLHHHHFIKEIKLRVKNYWLGQVFHLIKMARHRHAHG